MYAIVSLSNVSHSMRHMIPNKQPFNPLIKPHSMAKLCMQIKQDVSKKNKRNLKNNVCFTFIPVRRCRIWRGFLKIFSKFKICLWENIYQKEKKVCHFLLNPNNTRCRKIMEWLQLNKTWYLFRTTPDHNTIPSIFITHKWYILTHSVSQSVSQSLRKWSI